MFFYSGRSGWKPWTICCWATFHQWICWRSMCKANRKDEKTQMSVVHVGWSKNRTFWHSNSPVCWFLQDVFYLGQVSQSNFRDGWLYNQLVWQPCSVSPCPGLQLFRSCWAKENQLVRSIIKTYLLTTSVQDDMTVIYTHDMCQYPTGSELEVLRGAQKALSQAPDSGGESCSIIWNDDNFLPFVFYFAFLNFFLLVFKVVVLLCLLLRWSHWNQRFCQGRICVIFLMTGAARFGQREELESQEVVKAYRELLGASAFEKTAWEKHTCCKNNPGRKKGVLELYDVLNLLCCKCLFFQVMFGLFSHYIT